MKVFAKIGYVNYENYIIQLHLQQPIFTYLGEREEILNSIIYFYDKIVIVCFCFDY